MSFIDFHLEGQRLELFSFNRICFWTSIKQRVGLEKILQSICATNPKDFDLSSKRNNRAKFNTSSDLLWSEWNTQKIIGIFREEEKFIVKRENLFLWLTKIDQAEKNKETD